MIEHGITRDRPRGRLFVGFKDPCGQCRAGMPASRACVQPRLFQVGLLDPVSIGINGDHRGDRYCGARGEILRPPQDQQLRKHFSRVFSLIKNESLGIEDDQIPS